MSTKPSTRIVTGARIYNLELHYTFVGEVAELPPTFNGSDAPALVAAYMADAFHASPEIESFWVIFVNRKLRPTARRCISTGTLTHALAHPRDVFRAAILAGCAGVICVHNHPSGDPCPSAQDIHVTRLLRETAKAIDIELIDHVIIGDSASDPLGVGHYSFRAAGII